MSLTSWFVKGRTKEILKGILQAVQEFVDELLASKKTVRDTTSRLPTAPNDPVDNHYPTDKEIKQQAHNILKGNK